MSELTQKSVYTSSSCNKTKRAVDCGYNKFIIYGSCQSIYVCSLTDESFVSSAAVSHENLVTSVVWIKKPNFDNETEAISCSADNSVIVWNFANAKLTELCTLYGHTAKVTISRGLYTTDKSGNITHTLIASTSVDSTVKLWEREGCGGKDFKCIQTLTYGSGFALDVALVQIPGQAVTLLACATDTDKVILYVKENEQFELRQTLIGHEGWVQGLDFAIEDTSDILLASCSVDSYIRVWRIANTISTSNEGNDDDIKLKEDSFNVKTDSTESVFSVKLETILQGHDSWVHAVQWQPAKLINGKPHQPMRLLSASIDKTLIIWKPDKETGLWLEDVRVGDVGGNTLGFYGAVFNPTEETIIGHGYQGAMHVWNYEASSDSWQCGVTVGGHFSDVQDIAWEPKHGRYLLSVGLDQTTRLHAYWKHGKQSAWHEIARPQVHGYDMQCLAAINSHRFVSAADEKVLRIFEATKNFDDNFQSLCSITLDQRPDAPVGASVAALGLSNTAVFSSALQSPTTISDADIRPGDDTQYKEKYFNPIALQAPPSEVDLLQNTLWVEVMKLYGHGYEIYSVASHPDGSIIASACKASKVEHACIILWDTTTWKKITTLSGSTLTVTQLAFSHRGQYLLAVSRDRTWSLYQQTSEADSPYKLIHHTDKKTSIHSRIIWGCAWTYDDQYFVTVSRDKKALIWGKTADSFTVQGAAAAFEGAITAVDCAPVKLSSGYLVAFGMESGCIYIYHWNASEWTRIMSLDKSEAHHRTVKRLKFCPLPGTPTEPEDKHTIQLASCAADHAVKIHNLTFIHSHFC